jgi:hypothetical protein
MEDAFETALLTDDISLLLQDSGLDPDSQATACLIAAAGAARRAGIAPMIAVAMLSQFYGRFEAMQ